MCHGNPVRHEGIHGRGRIRVPDGETAHDQAVVAESQLAAQDIRIPGHAVLRATAETLGDQSEQDVLQVQPYFEKGSRRGRSPQVEDHRDRRTIESQVVAQIARRPALSSRAMPRASRTPAPAARARSSVDSSMSSPPASLDSSLTIGRLG